MENKTIPELQSLLDAVEKKYGRPIVAHNDFNTLSVVLDHECHEILSSSTLKRLWGYVSLRTTPRKSTLDLSADMIPENGSLRIGWEPNRLLRIRRTGINRFEVIESHNSKLKVGDQFETSCFFKGLPLILPTVYRNGEKLPSYIAGKEKGLNLLQAES